MFTTILDEAVNGWILTIFGGLDGKQTFIYERLIEAQEHRARVELQYEYGKKSEVNNNAFTV